jgi:hypothetical protein
LIHLTWAGCPSIDARTGGSREGSRVARAGGGAGVGYQGTRGSFDGDDLSGGSVECGDVAGGAGTGSGAPAVALCFADLGIKVVGMGGYKVTI